jgi:hypothetical protein
MHNSLLITGEILIVIVLPLLVLYRRGPWSLRTQIACLLTIPILWYPLYAPLHELGHVAGTYLALGRVVDYKFIPRFWVGEFGHAWIVSEGLRANAQWLLSTAFPYVLDVACVVTGFYLLRPKRVSHGFWVGFLFMLLCLRPAFDFICETIAYRMGDRGDIFYIWTFVGDSATWGSIVLAHGTCLFVIAIILRRYGGSVQWTR